MTLWSAACCQYMGRSFFVRAYPSAARKPFTVRPLKSDHPRFAARGLPFGLEDSNDRKFRGAGSL
jgi:hypothetical protein